MTFMMGGRNWLRLSVFVPDFCTAFFYAGLGLALGLARIIFIENFIKYNEILNREKLLA